MRNTPSKQIKRIGIRFRLGHLTENKLLLEKEEVVTRIGIKASTLLARQPLGRYQESGSYSFLYSNHH